MTAAKIGAAPSLLLCVLVAACSSTLGHNSALPASHALQGSTQFVVHVPQKDATKASSVRLHPQYVSPAMKSIQITVHQGATQVASLESDVTAGSPNCQVPQPLGYLVCSVPLSLPSGAYSGTFTTYDATGGANGGGRVLSSTTGAAFTVVANQANTIGITLDGVPASLLVVPDSGADHVFVNGSLTYAIAGTRPQQFFVTALDADKNFIVGPGAPGLTVTSSDTSKVTVAGSSANPNAFTLQVAAYSANAITLHVNATPPGGSAQPLTQAYTIQTAQEMWVTNLNGASVSAYAVVPGAIPVQIPDDTISGAVSGLNSPIGIASDAHGNLWVADAGTNSVYAFAPGMNTPIAADTIHPNPSVTGNVLIAFDKSGVLWVSNESANVVQSYSAGSSVPIAVVGGSPSQLNGPEGIAFDSAGNLWVANDNNTILSFAPGTSTPVASKTIAGTPSTLNGPYGINFDSAGNLWIGNFMGNDVLEFAAGSSAPTATIANIPQASDPAFDGLGNQWVTSGNPAAAVHSITNGNAAFSFSNGLNNPQFVAFTP